MNIEDVLISKNFVLKPTTKWVAIQDLRPSFEKAFGTKRFGKLQGTHMYVTLDVAKDACERLITAAGFVAHHLASTDGSGRTYPGFDTTGVSSATLQALVSAFYSAVDQHVRPN
jgi:hypothetical protein